MTPNNTKAKPTALIALIAASVALVSLSGCIGGAQGASTLYVKDALTDEVAEVHVKFTKAQAQAPTGDWKTIYEGSKEIELLSLSDSDAKAALGDFDLPPGDYTGLRIAVSEVTVTHLDGTEELLNVFGNVVSIADDFTVTEDGIDILVDFDLDAGVDLDGGTYTPIVKDVQTSDDDSDGDGIDDVDDTDDDDDGIEDADDDDVDGDGDDDEPEQRHGTLAEVCAAERDDETADATKEFEQEQADAAAERDAVLNDENATEEEKAEAQRDYDEDIAEAQREYDEELAEAAEDHDECVNDFDDDDDDEDEEDDEDEDEKDDAEDDEDDDGNETEA